MEVHEGQVRAAALRDVLIAVQARQQEVALRLRQLRRTGRVPVSWTVAALGGTMLDGHRRGQGSLNWLDVLPTSVHGAADCCL